MESWKRILVKCGAVALYVLAALTLISVIDFAWGVGGAILSLGLQCLGLFVVCVVIEAVCNRLAGASALDTASGWLGIIALCCVCALAPVTASAYLGAGYPMPSPAFQASIDQHRLVRVQPTFPPPVIKVRPLAPPYPVQQFGPNRIESIPFQPICQFVFKPIFAKTGATFQGTSGELNLNEKLDFTAHKTFKEFSIEIPTPVIRLAVRVTPTESLSGSGPLAMPVSFGGHSFTPATRLDDKALTVEAAFRSFMADAEITLEKDAVFRPVVALRGVGGYMSATEIGKDTTQSPFTAKESFNKQLIGVGGALRYCSGPSVCVVAKAIAFPEAPGTYWIDVDALLLGRSWQGFSGEFAVGYHTESINFDVPSGVIKTQIAGPTLTVGLWW